MTIVESGGCSITVARLGNATYAPAPPVTQDFTVLFNDISPTAFADVPASGPGSFGFKFVQAMYELGITAGCAKAAPPATLLTYCPNESVTRAQMAVFMMAGLFNFPLAPTAPAITAISPATLARGTSGTFTITGVNTTFTQGVTTLSAIPGVTIRTITVNSATSLTVQLTAAADATPRPYTIEAITNSEQDVLPNSLIVQ